MDKDKPVSKTNHPARRRTDLGPDQGRRSDSTPDEDRRYNDSVERRLAAFEDKLDKNTALTERSVALFEGMEAGIKVLGALGAFAKWATPIIILGATIWALVTGKPLPGKGN